MGSKKLMGQIWRICSKVRRTCEEIAKVNGRGLFKHQGGYNFATRSNGTRVYVILFPHVPYVMRHPVYVYSVSQPKMGFASQIR